MDQQRAVDEHERRFGAGTGGRGVLVFVPEASREAAVDLSTMLRALKRDRAIHIALLLGCLAVAAAFAFLPRPVYRAIAVLVPVSDSQQSGLLSNLEGGLGSLIGVAGIDLGLSDDFRKEALALLTSRDFTVRFIEEESIMPALFAKKWDADRGTWRTKEAPTIDQALELFDRSVRRVTEDRRNGLVLVAIEWTDRVLAAKWANSLVARANAELRRRTIEDAERSLEFLRRELERTTPTELQLNLYRLIETELRRKMLASVREEYAFRTIDPARVPMENRPVRPRRALAIAMGLAVAFLASGWLAWMRARRADRGGTTRAFAGSA